MNRKKGAELLRLDKAKEAEVYLRRCIDVTHEMAKNLMSACRLRNVDCIVAPYEADAQLAYFSMNDIVDLIDRRPMNRSPGHCYCRCYLILLV